MTWTHTSRGRALDLLNPQHEDVDLDEIATRGTLMVLTARALREVSP